MLIVLVLALGALLLALGTPVADAAPPEVKASENPVVIPWATTTKDIQLTWSLEAWQPLENLTVTEGGTPTPVLDQTVSSAPGDSRTLTVTACKTYTAQLRELFTKQPLGAPLVITTKRPPIGPLDVGCVVQCITGVGVTPNGGWAQFTVKTNETAIMKLEASTTQPNGNGTWSNPNAVSASTATILPTQNWTPPLANLKSNTTYYYVVRAHDTNGNEQFKTGSFKTLTRRVDVTFAEIQMIDDSDGFGAGDCDFWFKAGNSADTPYGSDSNQKSIASGTSVHPNITVTVANAPGEIALRVSGNDDDTDFGEFCPAGIGPRYEGTGNIEECLEWAGGQTQVSLSRQGPPAAPGDVDEQFTESFTISVSGELVYKVRGTYKLTYVP